MKRKVGLWIDHRKAVIVFLAGEEEEMNLENCRLCRASSLLQKSILRLLV